MRFQVEIKFDLNVSLLTDGVWVVNFGNLILSHISDTVICRIRACVSVRLSVRNFESGLGFYTHTTHPHWNEIRVIRLRRTRFESECDIFPCRIVLLSFAAAARAPLV